MRGVCCPFLPPEDKKGSAAVGWAEPWQAIIPGMGLALLCEKRHQNDPVSQHSAPLAFLSGIVQSDPAIPVDRTLIPSPPPRPKNPVFDDEEKSKVKHTPAKSVLRWGGRWGLARCCGSSSSSVVSPGGVLPFPFVPPLPAFSQVVKKQKPR